MKKFIFAAAIFAASTTAVFANTTAVESVNSVEATQNQESSFEEMLSFEMLNKDYKFYTLYEIDNMSYEDAKGALNEYLQPVAYLYNNFSKNSIVFESAQKYFRRTFNTSFFGSEQECKDLLREYYDIVLRYY